MDWLYVAPRSRAKHGEIWRAYVMTPKDPYLRNIYPKYKGSSYSSSHTLYQNYAGTVGPLGETLSYFLKKLSQGRTGGTQAPGELPSKVWNSKPHLLNCRTGYCSEAEGNYNRRMSYSLNS